MDGREISFGPFRLLAERRLVLEGGTPVRLGSRAFDILAALVERAGNVVGKEELIARAWPQAFVEEWNLRIQVSALRRALGDGQNGHRYVVTVPGRGYNFVAPVTFGEPSHHAPVPSPLEHNLPYAVTRMIGREDAVAALVSLLSNERLVTIVGPGGIGKTTVALAVAERVIADYRHGVRMVDLAPIGDARLVPSAVAAVLGLEIRADDPLPGLVACLRDRQMLLLLDNCEHVIDAVAGLAAAVLGGAPGAKILATSREPPGIAGERDYRLGPLGSPPSSPEPTAAEAASYPAVQLFVARATAIVEDFVLTDTNAARVVEICRRLDGLPLAIEFAAPRVEALGVEGLAARLDDSLPLLAGRRRTAAPRHRTMRAVLDWSFGLLNEDEQQFLRACGIFSGGFTVEAAAAVAAASTRTAAMERLADLVAKSLVVADVTGAEPRFRLLDTTRAYAIEQLDESGGRRRIARRHAVHFRDVFERAEAEAAARPAGEWLGDYAPEIDNVRAALDWAFSPGGDRAIGVLLTAAAVPLWLRLSLLRECRGRARQALGGDGICEPRDALRLYAALGAATPEPAEMGAAFTKALEIAESLGDTEYQLRALGGLYFFHAASNRHEAALTVAQKFQDRAASGSDPSAQSFGDHIVGAARHFLGDQVGARRHLERVLARYDATDHRRDVIRFQIDVQVWTQALLARVLWLQGLADQAVRAAELSVERAQAAAHALSLCNALALAACPIALWVGDLAAAARYTGMLLDNASKHGLSLWGDFGAGFQRAVALQGGGFDPPEEIAEPGSAFRFWTGLGEQVEALVHAGRIGEGLALLDAGTGQSDAGWITPELLRLRGELLACQGAPADTSESLFRQALDQARRQGALAWELRAATSLARRLRDQGRPADATAILRPVYERFAEGFDSADLVAARRLL